MAGTFLSLPPELINMICHALNMIDIKHLRFCCKQLSDFLEKSVLRKITFKVNATNISSFIPNLRCMASGGLPATSRATTALDIRYLVPTFDPYRPPETSYIGKWGRHSRPPIPPEVVLAEAEMVKYLLPALVSLKNVHSVRWETYDKDDEWAQNTVATALRTFRALRTLRLEIDYLKIAVPLHLLRRLEDFTIIETNPSSGDGFYHKTYLNMGRMIASTPELTSIYVKRGGFGAGDTHPSACLHQLFWFFKGDTPPLRLRRISLDSVFVKLDDVTLRHFRHLVALDLYNIFEPPGPDDTVDSGGHEIDPELAAAQRVAGSTVDEIWVALIDLGLRLEEININKVTPSFLKYLESYSGLIKLRIHVNKFGSAAESDERANQFFKNPLAMHTHTLKELKIRPILQGLWGLGDHNASALLSCTQVGTLEISVNPRHGKDTSAADADTREDPIVSFIHNASLHLPRLRTLMLCITNDESARDDWGGSSTKHFDQVQSQTADLLRTYSAPPSRKHLPTVLIAAPGSLQTFVPGRAAFDLSTGKRGEWRYRDTRPSTAKKVE